MSYFPALNHRLSLALALFACACRRDAGGGAAADSSRPMTVRPTPSVAFRVPRGAGPIRVYGLPDLSATPWGSGSRIAGATSAVGTDRFGRRLIYRDSAGAVTSFDLVAMRERRIGPPRSLAAIGADGTVYAVDPTGQIIESQTWGTRNWPASLGRGVRYFYAAPGARLLAVRESGGDTLQIAGRETGLAQAYGVPASPARAASLDGDAIAFAVDSGVIVYEDRAMDQPWFVRVGGKPRAVAFSPSGHRLFLALAERDELAVVDRFEHEEEPSIPLPAPARALRMDPWGRVLLVDGGGGDVGSTYVVSMAEGRVTGRLRTDWASDLPTISENGELLARENEAVVARDVRSLDSLGAVPNAAGDVWLTGRWTSASLDARQSAQAALPAGTTPGPIVAAPAPAAAAAPAPAPASQPATGGTHEGLSGGEVTGHAPAKPNEAPAEPLSTYFVQLAATRNESAARAMVAVLATEGHIVEAVAPPEGDDMWRVMGGPYRSREAADSAGRSWGRAYWVVEKPVRTQ